MSASPERVEDRLAVANRPWRLVVWNDPVNLMSYVEYVFKTYFGLSAQRAHERMLEVHNEGRAILARGVRENLEMHVTAMHGFGLWATLEREG